MTRAAAIALVVAGCAPPAAPTAHPQQQQQQQQMTAPLHLLGEAPAAPASVGPPGTLVDAIYHVCLDEGGRVDRVEPAPGLAAVDEAVTAALHKWSWFVVTSEARPCFDAPVRLAVPARSHILRQASAGVVAQLTRGPAPQPPAWVSSAHAGQIVDASYKVCVGDDGLVQSVRPMMGVVGAANALASALRASSWDIVVGPLAQAPYCFAAPVRLDFTRARRDLGRSPALPFTKGAMHDPERGVSVIVRARAGAHPPPHLPPLVAAQLVAGGVRELDLAYRLCVAADGTVARVDAIHPAPGDDRSVVDTLRSWTFALEGPPGVGYCQPARIQLSLGLH